MKVPNPGRDLARQYAYDAILRYGEPLDVAELKDRDATFQEAYKAEREHIIQMAYDRWKKKNPTAPPRKRPEKKIL